MSFRAFISVDLDVGEGIRQLCGELRDTGAALKVVDPEIVHLTLKFLGDMDEKLVPGIREAMIASVEGVPPFQVRFQSVGAFPARSRPRVVWVGVKNVDPLISIAERLDERLSSLGFEREKRLFSPHLTVARAKGSRGMNRIQAVMDEWRDREIGVETVDSIRLKKSVLDPRGPTYSTVEEICLGD